MTDEERSKARTERGWEKELPHKVEIGCMSLYPTYTFITQELMFCGVPRISLCGINLTTVRLYILPFRCRLTQVVLQKVPLNGCLSLTSIFRPLFSPDHFSGSSGAIGSVYASVWGTVTF